MKIINKTYIIIFIFLFYTYAGCITLTVLPFKSQNTNWITEYSVDDGIPRMLADMLTLTHRFEVTDYDILISYFSSYDTVLPYTSLSTNIDIACNFALESFNSDYVISGDVTKFDFSRADKDTANVEFKINIIDCKTKNIVKTLTAEGNHSLPKESGVYKSEDAFFNESALGKASIEALSILSKDISIFFNNPPITGIITRIEKNKYYINLGSNNNIKIGDVFEIYDVKKTLELPTNYIYTNETNTNSITNYLNINTNDYFNTNYNIANTNSLSNNITVTNTYFSTDNKGYEPIRSNKEGDIWYTSEMLYNYRYNVYKEDIVASAKVVSVYANYAILQNLDNQSDLEKIKLLMKVKLKI